MQFYLCFSEDILNKN